MPSRATHRAMTALVMQGYDGDEAHAAIDSTARAHGPAHRHDEVHSPEGAVLELMRRGQATPRSVQAVYAHLAQDKMVDGILAFTRLKGPSRQLVKAGIEKTIVRIARRRGR
ncbi:MAG: hypothetical protein ACREB9_00230 [Thermoplasmata archaeon]